MKSEKHRYSVVTRMKYFTETLETADLMFEYSCLIVNYLPAGMCIALPRWMRIDI